MWSLLRQLFYIKRSDRTVLTTGLVVALLVVGGILWSEHAPLGNGQPEATTCTADSDSLARGADTLQTTTAYHADTGQAPRRETFAFDPNTADSTTLLRLGLRPFQVRSIYRYRAKGGVFSRVEDFARVPGLTKGEYRRLAPCINIADDFRPATELLATQKPRTQKDESGTARPHEGDSTRRPRKLLGHEQVPLNSADTTTLQRVPGIGNYWARRIVGYRELLGGYHSVYQLTELSGFPQDALPYFTLPEDGNSLRQIDLNRLSVEQLAHHPYITITQAREIVNHRRIHGPITSLDNLRLAPHFSDEDLQRLQPYVKCQTQQNKP